MVTLIDFQPKQKSLVKKYLDLNRRYHADIDPLKLRLYDPNWAVEETEKVLEKIQAGTGFIKFIDVENQIIGMLYYYMEKSDIVHLSKIYIDKEYRGKGYGKEAMELFFEEIKSKKYKYISLNVFAPNENAIKLYRDLGFLDRFTDMLKPI